MFMYMQSKLKMMNFTNLRNCVKLVTLNYIVSASHICYIYMYTNMSICFMFHWYIRATFKQKRCIEIINFILFNIFESFFTAKKTEHLPSIDITFIIDKNYFKYYCYMYITCASSDHTTRVASYTYNYEES